MKWQLDWHPAAQAQLLAIHWRLASRIAAAVMSFAETGRGRVETTPASSRRLRLRIRGAVALIVTDPKARTLLVIGVYRRG